MRDDNNHAARQHRPAMEGRNRSRDAAAQMPGLDADPSFIDVGVGMNPELVGQGRGSGFGEVVLEHVTRLYPGRQPRAVMQAWNVRSLRFATNLGFIDAGELISTHDGRHVRYRVLLKRQAEDDQKPKAAIDDYSRLRLRHPC